jgi:poly(hydroxyalkanoate) depolymerase family esterase
MSMKAQQNLLAQMREATRHLLSKNPGTAASVIHDALSVLRPSKATPAQESAAPAEARPLHDINPPPAGARAAAAPPAMETPIPPAPTPAAPQFAQNFAQDLMARLGVPHQLSGFQDLNFGGFDIGNFGMPTAPGEVAPNALKEGAQFVAGSYANQAGGRDYKLYIPSTWHGQAMPLVVMLHGCTQNPDDFAAGTQMNAVAEEKQCFVVYPAQTQGANSSKCWNWFNALDQQRDQGEPSIIAGMTRQIIEQYPVDKSQVYIAGLSAGGAMAVIVGTLYPELFAAVGVHSGLPFASARDLPSALAAMRGGAMSSPPPATGSGGIPIIVFHGDRDTTVNPRNGDELMAQGLRSQLGSKAAPAASVDSGSVPNGHRYTRTTHRHADGSTLGEHWVIHGAGHAWSGGSQHGSYTDGKGPDASREMMRFFATVS